MSRENLYKNSKKFEYFQHFLSCLGKLKNGKINDQHNQQS